MKAGVLQADGGVRTEPHVPPFAPEPPTDACSTASCPSNTSQPLWSKWLRTLSPSTSSLRSGLPSLGLRTSLISPSQTLMATAMPFVGRG